MIKQLGDTFSRFSERYMPEPIIFAVLLTIVTFLLGLILTDSGLLAMVDHWYEGFWDLLSFTMQMVLILVTGHALATAPAVKKWIQRLASQPASSAQAAALTALVACAFSWFNWALGLIVGAIFALEIGKAAHRQGIKLHYPLIVAAGYSGQMVWHMGPSSSSGLTVATSGHFLEDAIGIIPITQTAFSSYALLNSLMLIAVVVPVTFYLMSPRKKDEMAGIDAYAPQFLKEEEPQPQQEDADSIGARMDSVWFTVVLLVLAGSYAIIHFSRNGFDLNLNIVNFLFLFLGLALHKTPVRYMNAVTDATKGASGIILQFPFYGGIMGMVTLSGLAVIFVDAMLSIATPQTLPVISWFAAGLLNIFVPSGGGQWAVQGPILMEVAKELDVSIGRIITAFGAGDTWTNMFQPFWALALLGITGVKARHIMGYCMTLLIISIPFYVIGLTFFP
ncbi:short-chain fatty acid transporter [Halomonas sp. ML-15]|uniref:short-chain fatty acid transporter n=1 Tax=Halomonas sp. ML-15 TaxID=2773305 RepID=UPI0017467292|nr:TIGR00366 family protein [Halomonas sp. ML-15]MBD3898297.1 short-chain fatty acid transporter [Halomonas sp. ML-15]